MNLQELQESKKTKIVKRALREHYEINIDFDSLSMAKAQSLLAKTKELMESSNAAHATHNNSAYLKLVMMEQALADRINDLRAPRPTIVVENEEVQKSQVILAAQDMVDSLQKMLESVSKMNVEELNAVVDGMKNEFGTAEGEQFNASVSEALAGLQAAITGAKNSVSGALSKLTGEGPGFDTGMPVEPGADLAPGLETGEVDADLEIEEPVGEPEEPEEPEDVSGAGRERR